MPPSSTDTTVVKLLEKIYIESEVDELIDAPELTDETAIPYLISALEDPRTHSVQFTGKWSHLNSPFEYLCHFIDAFAPTEAVDSLLPYASHTEKSFRECALYSLANIGSSETEAAILQGLSETDKDVLEGTIRGIYAGLTAGRFSSQFQQQLFPLIAKLIESVELHLASEAAHTLVLIDQHQATDVLLSPPLFNTGNSNFLIVLVALNEIEFKIPHETLMPLLKQLMLSSNEPPNCYLYGQILISFAINPTEITESYLTKQLTHSNESTLVDAATALAYLLGITDPWRLIQAKIEQEGEKSLPAPMKKFAAVMNYEFEVNNGGHSAFFYNAEEHTYHQTLRALQEINADKLQSILSAVGKLFGPKGPPTDKIKREKMLEKIEELPEEPLDELDTNFFESEENLEHLLLLYAIKHKKHFATTK